VGVASADSSGGGFFSDFFGGDSGGGDSGGGAGGGDAGASCGSSCGGGCGGCGGGWGVQPPCSGRPPGNETGEASRYAAWCTTTPEYSTRRCPRS